MFIVKMTTLLAFSYLIYIENIRRNHIISEHYVFPLSTLLYGR